MYLNPLKNSNPTEQQIKKALYQICYLGTKRSSDNKTKMTLLIKNLKNFCANKKISLPENEQQLLNKCEQLLNSSIDIDKIKSIQKTLLSQFQSSSDLSN